MANSMRSVNFSFLSTYGDMPSKCAALAEAYVWNDPNTSLIKVRQVGEMLAQLTAAKAGLDPTGMDYVDIVAMLWRSRIVPHEIRELFDNIRLRGNEAVHEHAGDRQGALAALITLHRLSEWFHRLHSEQPAFSAGTFRPPPNPSDASQPLIDELERLREEAAENQLAAIELESLRDVQAELEEVRFEASVAHHEREHLAQIREELEQEAKKNYAKLASTEEALKQAERDLLRQKLQFLVQIGTLKQQAQQAPSGLIASYIRRSQDAARSLGQSGGDEQHVPLAQLRIQGPRDSHCCKKPTLLVQSMKGGFVTANCSKCNSSSSLKAEEFEKLNVWVSCPKCNTRAEPARVGRSNYGYQCKKCRWSCLLASLLPEYTEIGAVPK